jgi:large subunit ribosomal protein L19
VDLLKVVENQQLQKKRPNFKAGDTLSVHLKISEGGKERVQVFNGIVIAKDGAGSNETFTMRKVSFGVGVERVFPVHSPLIQKIKVESRGDVNRAKLYFLRKLRGKKSRIKTIEEFGEEMGAAMPHSDEEAAIAVELTGEEVSEEESKEKESEKKENEKTKDTKKE